MKIIFTSHAKERIHERGIKFRDIKDTFEFPDYTIRRSDEKIEAYKKTNGKTLKIVYADKIKFIKVITLFYL